MFRPSKKILLFNIVLLIIETILAIATMKAVYQKNAYNV